MTGFRVLVVDDEPLAEAVTNISCADDSDFTRFHLLLLTRMFFNKIETYKLFILSMIASAT